MKGGCVARKLLFGSLVVLALLVTAGMLMRRLLDPQAVAAAIERQGVASLGQPVTVGSVSWAFSLRPRLVLRNVQVGSPAAMTFDRLELTASLGALLSKRVERAGITIAGSRITLPLPPGLGARGGAGTHGSSPVRRDGDPLTIISIDRISLSDIELAAGDKRLRLDVESALDGDRLVVSSFRLKSAQTSMEGSGEFSSLKAWRGTFSVGADPLDLDELLAVASAFASGGLAPEDPRATVAGQPAPMDVRLELKATRGRLVGINFTDLTAALVIGAGAIALDPFGIQVFDGRVNGRVSVDTKTQPPRASMSATAASVDVARMAAMAGQAGVLTGRLQGQIELHANAGAPDEVFRTAEGRASADIVDGTAPGLDLVGPVVLAFGKPGASAPAVRSHAFSRLGGTFTLARGVLSSSDLAMASPDWDLKGHGTLRVTGAAVNIHADLLLSEALSAQAGRDLRRYAKAGSRIALPVVIRGTLASPSVSIDTGAALERAARDALADEARKELTRLFKK
jgi:uncharacterized protein involved in outer membrane biogenesis